MISLNSLLLPALFGLVAGVSHGILTHQAGLPYSLSEQLLQPLQAHQSSF